MAMIATSGIVTVTDASLPSRAAVDGVLAGAPALAALPASARGALGAAVFGAVPRGVGDGEDFARAGHWSFSLPLVRALVRTCRERPPRALSIWLSGVRLVRWMLTTNI